MLGESRRLRLDEGSARSRLAELSEQLGVEIDPDARAADLALGHQQQVEIVKALWRGSRLLILDEPTSMLTPQGVAELAKVLDRLKQSGQAVIFITHKLHEALSLGDAISILRHGRLVGQINARELGDSLALGAEGRDRADHVRRRGPDGGGGRRAQRRPHGSSIGATRRREHGGGARATWADRLRRRDRTRDRRRLLRAARGRDRRHRRHGRERPARTRRSDRRAAASEPRTRLSLRRRGDESDRLPATEARTSLRDRRPTRRGNRGGAPGQPQPLPQARR